MLRSFSFGSAGDIFWIFSYFDDYKMASLPVSAAIRVNITSVRITQKKDIRNYYSGLGVQRAGFLHQLFLGSVETQVYILFGYPRRPETASQTFINRQGSEHYDHGAQLARDQTWCALGPVTFVGSIKSLLAMERIDRVRVKQTYGKLTPLCDHPAANLTDFCALGCSLTRLKY